MVPRFRACADPSPPSRFHPRPPLLPPCGTPVGIQCCIVVHAAGASGGAQLRLARNACVKLCQRAPCVPRTVWFTSDVSPHAVACIPAQPAGRPRLPACCARHVVHGLRPSSLRPQLGCNCRAAPDGGVTLQHNPRGAPPRGQLLPPAPLSERPSCRACKPQAASR